MTLLPWLPPFDRQWIFAFLRTRAVSGIETFSEETYSRSLALAGHRGLITVTADDAAQGLRVSLSDGLLPVADECLKRVARLFDLSCDPRQVAQVLGPLAQARPGLRLPGSLDVFEQAVRAVLGQLVSVAMAAKLTAKVVAAFGEPLAAPEDIDAGMKQLQTLPGIGRWTASYFALRGWQAQDIFLADDYLIKQRFSGMTPARIAHYARRWQPLRSYALLHIWYTEGWTPTAE